MIPFTRCQHCVHGFAEDHSHPTERRLKECEFCRGTGRIAKPMKIPPVEDRDTEVDDEINRRRMGWHFESQHWVT